MNICGKPSLAPGVLNNRPLVEGLGRLNIFLYNSSNLLTIQSINDMLSKMGRSTSTYIRIGCALVAICIVLYILFILYNQKVKSYCIENTGVYRYEQFSKSTDPIKNEYQAKNRYRKCLINNNVFYRYQMSKIESACIRQAIKTAGGKAEMLFPVSPNDWYEFNNSSTYTGFVTYVQKENIECLKRSDLIKSRLTLVLGLTRL